jgi:hypothetical protein
MEPIKGYENQIARLKVLAFEYFQKAKVQRQSGEKRINAFLTLIAGCLLMVLLVFFLSINLSLKITKKVFFGFSKTLCGLFKALGKDTQVSRKCKNCGHEWLTTQTSLLNRPQTFSTGGLTQREKRQLDNKNQAKYQAHLLKAEDDKRCIKCGSNVSEIKVVRS